MLRVFASLLAAGVAVTLNAQAPLRPGGPQSPARDSGAQVSGTARIRGRVVAADSGRPLRKAQVRAASASTREARVTSTDADGRYEFKELPAGRYQIGVTKGSFVSLSYGQLRPFEAGKPLEIADAQIVERVNFALPRGGVITGRVVDEFGEPIADVRVTPMRYQYVQGRRQLNASGRQGTTNDIGEYRLFGLAPGQYVLAATLQAGGGLTVDASSDDRSGYAPTYFPGTSDASQAQRVTIGIGQALSEINMPLVAARTARVSGTVTDAEGTLLSSGMVVVLQRGGGAGLGVSGTTVKPDGSFTLSSLAPGDYLLQVVNPGAIGDRSEMPSGQVTVAGEDVTGVQLAGMRATIGRGRVIVDAAIGKPLPASGLRVMTAPARPDDDTVAAIGIGARVKDDLTFELKTRPGLALVRAEGAPPGWALKAVRQNGTDVTDTGIEFRRDEEISGIEIELTNRTTEVSGSVTNSRSEPVKDYTVVVFSTSRERWGFMSRFFRTGRPDQDGRYEIKTLPAGEYYAIALEYVEPGQASDPEFLDAVKARATTFGLTDGETKTLNLKISTS